MPKETHGLKIAIKRNPIIKQDKNTKNISFQKCLDS